MVSAAVGSGAGASPPDDRPWEISPNGDGYRPREIVESSDPGRDPSRGSRRGAPWVALAPLTTEAAVWAALPDRLTFAGDPIDRMIHASAHDLRVPLVTKDEKLRPHPSQAGDIDGIW